MGGKIMLLNYKMFYLVKLLKSNCSLKSIAGILCVLCRLVLYLFPCDESDVPSTHSCIPKYGGRSNLGWRGKEQRDRQGGRDRERESG